jgi:hypothetical protein
MLAFAFKCLTWNLNEFLRFDFINFCMSVLIWHGHYFEICVIVMLICLRILFFFANFCILLVTMFEKGAV